MEFDEAQTREAYSWMQVFRSVLNFTARPQENIDDIIFGAMALGLRRARLLERGLEYWQDVPHALSIFCWWRFKPVMLEGNREFLLAHRMQLFAGASTDREVINRILAVVPDEILKLRTDELFDLLQQTPIDEILRLEARA